MGDNLGFGVTANLSYYSQTAEDGLDYHMVDYDVTAYLAYHLFGGKAFLDPFGEVGGGLMATDFADTSDKDTLNPYKDAPLFASYYWYGALGLGVNLGPIGIFGKFAYNFPIKKAVEAEWNPDTTGGMTGSTTLYPYGYDPNYYKDGYIPSFRFTLGAKLIL
jgi:hypothetical protein